MSNDFTEFDKLLKKDVAVGLFYTGMAAAGTFLLLYLSVIFRIATGAAVGILQNLVIDGINTVLPDKATNIGLIAVSAFLPWILVVGLIKGWKAYKSESLAKALAWVLYIPLGIIFVTGLILYLYLRSAYLQSFQ